MPRAQCRLLADFFFNDRCLARRKGRKRAASSVLDIVDMQMAEARRKDDARSRESAPVLC